MSKALIGPLLSLKMGATELYLVRHADALPGPETVIPGGGYDEQPLSELGRRQAEAVGEWLSDLAFTAIYASPLRRTQETAAPLARRQAKEVIVEPGLREVKLHLDKGPKPGDDLDATAGSLKERLGEVVRLIAERGKWSLIPGSEESAAFRTRVVAAVHEIAARHAGERIVLFTHGGFINAYFAEVLGLERDFFFPIQNTSVSVARWLNDNVSLVSLNETAHLRQVGLEPS